MTIYRGYSGVNREIKSQYRGLSGVNREIKEQYRGYSGVNRKVFSSSPASSPAGAVYWDGDECTALTGGWSTMSYRTTYTAVHTVTENSNNITITSKGAVSDSGQTLYTHTSAVDLTNYTTLHCIGNVQYVDDGFGIVIMSAKHSNAMSGSYTTWPGYVTRSVEFSTTDIETTIDVSSLNGLYYIYMLCTEGYANSSNVQTQAVIKRVWLT
jgi:hypothetical protein